jgi:two-component system sensor histidine kinase QseC
VNSIRVFLVLVILAVLTLFTFVAALRGYQSSMQKADQLFDKQMMETARLLADFQENSDSGNSRIESDVAFQVWKGGKLRAASRNAPADAIAPFATGLDYSNFGGYRWRTVGYFDQANDRWILVAERTDLRFLLAENVILESIFPVIVGLPAVGILIWLLVSQGLKPLRRLANELRNKQPDDLSPLSVRSPKQELEQIVLSTNGLLERLETSLLREKQFASDAAHELRTPISVLKVQLYNIAQELPQLSSEFDELEQTAARLEHLVEQILDLYRSSPDRFNATFETIDLSSLAQEVLAGEFPRFDERNQTLEFQGEYGAIRGDPFALKTLIRNLLSNANRYTPRGGQVLVSIGRSGGSTTLAVEDSGPGIPANLQERIFERFYRIGGDRHESSESGCGLGLAIAKRIVDLHDATIEVTPSRFAPGAAFRVTFPSAPADGQARRSNA